MIKPIQNLLSSIFLHNFRWMARRPDSTWRTASKGHHSSGTVIIKSCPHSVSSLPYWWFHIALVVGENPPGRRNTNIDASLTSFFEKHQNPHCFQKIPRIYQPFSGWWFGCHEFYFPINIGLLIIPIDELHHFFQRGWVYNHQPAWGFHHFPSLSIMTWPATQLWSFPDARPLLKAPHRALAKAWCETGTHPWGLKKLSKW